MATLTTTQTSPSLLGGVVIIGGTIIGAGMFSLPVVIISMGDLMFPGRNWILMFLSVPVVFWAGAPFFSAAWKSAREVVAMVSVIVPASLVKHSVDYEVI